MGHMAMLHLTEESLKSLFEIHLNQITINSLVFRLTGSTTIASAFALSGEGATCSETARWLLGEISSCLVIHLILSSKVRFWFTKGITLLKRTLEHWARGTFSALITKEQNVMVTETNTPLILSIAFAIENKTKTQQNKYSVVGVFWPRLDLKTAGEKPLLSVLVEIFVWCTRFSFIGLNRARNFYFFFATWVRCITTLGRACWR